VARQQPVAYVDETGAPTENADGGNPNRKRGWQWVKPKACAQRLVTPVVTVFLQGLSRSAAAAMELLGSAFAGTVVSDRFSAYNHLPLEQRQLCWAHLIRDLTAIAERQGASGEIGAQLLGLQQQLFAHWHQWKTAAIDWSQLQQGCRPIRQAFVAALQRVVELGCERGEQTPWAKTVRTCDQLLQRSDGLWTFLEGPGGRTHQQRRRESPAPVGDSAQDQPWRSIHKRCDLPQPPAHSHGHPQATGQRCLELPGAGLDRPAPRWRNAIAGARSLRRQSDKPATDCPLERGHRALIGAMGCPDP
jgi:hypothetical protein